MLTFTRRAVERECASSECVSVGKVQAFHQHHSICETKVQWADRAVHRKIGSFICSPQRNGISQRQISHICNDHRMA